MGPTMMGGSEPCRAGGSSGSGVHSATSSSISCAGGWGRVSAVLKKATRPGSLFRARCFSPLVRSRPRDHDMDRSRAHVRSISRESTGREAEGVALDAPSR